MIIDLKDIKPGDKVVTPDGNHAVVERVYEEHTPETMYEIEVADKKKWYKKPVISVLEVSGNHLFYIETIIDRQSHKYRVKNAKRKLNETLDPDLLDYLKDLSHKKDVIIETALIDVVELLDAHTDSELLGIIYRIAEAIGHIAEEHETVTEVLDDTEILKQTIRKYDATVFAQQILALYGDKEWTVKKGRVVTADEMSELMGVIRLPKIKPLF